MLNKAKFHAFFEKFSHWKLKPAPTQEKFLDFLQNEFPHSKCFQKASFHFEFWKIKKYFWILFWVDECTTAATHQELGGIWAHDVAVVTYSGVTEIEKDASCCKQCAARSDCEYWVRDTFSSQCWLKSNSGNDILSMNHPHRRGGIKAGKRGNMFLNIW